jgi:hypothetical protein
MISAGGAFKRWLAGPDLAASNRRLAAVLIGAISVLCMVAAATILLYQ